jgi:glycosyltransferase involved in cell wall biosynthesis
MKHRVPFVSAVVPCLNERQFIDACLDSILANDYPEGHVEVLVVDGRSTDGTRSLVEKYVQQWHPRVQLLDNPRGIIPAAMNIGIQHAKGDVIVKMDAHARYKHNYT